MESAASPPADAPADAPEAAAPPAASAPATDDSAAGEPAVDAAGGTTGEAEAGVVAEAAAVETPLPAYYSTIAQIQGTADNGSMIGETRSTRGVVTAVYPSTTYPTSTYNGYTIQTPGTGGPQDVAARTASDGLFVFSASTAGLVRPGDFVQVTGPISEFQGLTEITVSSTAGLVVLPDEHDPVTAATAPWPGANDRRETLESMLFRPTGDYTVTNTFATNQFGEVGLAFGTKPLISRPRWRTRSRRPARRRRWTTPRAPSPSTTAPASTS